jgi:N-acetyl sugar amidotransferase
MDTSDPAIFFDEAGVCNHCLEYDSRIRPRIITGENGRRQWGKWVDTIKAAGKGHDYDCIIGISGGVDSAYLAWMLKDSGLRPLAVHVDGGWNSEVAVKNIELLVKSLHLDLYTHVVDWDEMRDLQVAFLKASVPNQDIPQDHAFFGQLHRQAIKFKIKFFLSGVNFATEGILPRSWGHSAMDLRHLRAVHAQFGSRPLVNFPQIGFFDTYFINPYIRRFKVIQPLNYVEYSKDRAKAQMAEAFGWRDYGGKHHESRWTKFFQNYYLPHKFGFDKRRAHLSSLIVSEQMSRDGALAEMEMPLYDLKELLYDKEFVAKKLGMTTENLDGIIALPPRSHMSYPTNSALYSFKDKVAKFLR